MTNRRGHLARLKAQGARTRAEFAEALAKGASIAEAAAAAGVTRQRGTVLLKEIKAKLGWQAQ